MLKDAVDQRLQREVSHENGCAARATRLSEPHQTRTAEIPLSVVCAPVAQMNRAAVS
jgi:hypothetical protein